MSDSVWEGLISRTVWAVDQLVHILLQCSPQELAILLPALKRVATAFDDFDGASLGDFRSELLNEIVLSLPKLKSPVQEYLNAISLKGATEGKKESLWTDTERFPKITEYALVSPP